MKVVLFCGGLGLRIRDNENIPKPMITIGYRPLVWHLMKYYAHFGFKDFILCLGYRADCVKQYFLTYNECVSNDFTLSEGGRRLDLLRSDISDWRITFVDTGLRANLGQRLQAVQTHLEKDDCFFANYSDGLTNLPLPDHMDFFLESGKVASFVSVKPNVSCHVVRSETDGRVTSIEDIARTEIRINGGFFIFRRQIFDYMRDGEELVEEPFKRLIAGDQLVAYRYDGFWQAVDTFKDRQKLEQMYADGTAPWEVWKTPAAGNGSERPPTSRERARSSLLAGTGTASPHPSDAAPRI